jgi:hypothetical protein
MTRMEMATMYQIQYWSLPELQLKHEFCCPKTMNTYARLVIQIILVKQIFIFHFVNA